MAACLVQDVGKTRSMSADDTAKTREELIAEVERLRKELADLGGRPAGGAPGSATGDLVAPRGALHETRELLSRAVANTPLVVWALDPDGVFVLSEGKGLEAISEVACPTTT